MNERLHLRPFMVIYNNNIEWEGLGGAATAARSKRLRSSAMMSRLWVPSKMTGIWKYSKKVWRSQLLLAVPKKSHGWEKNVIVQLHEQGIIKLQFFLFSMAIYGKADVFRQNWNGYRDNDILYFQININRLSYTISTLIT